MKKKEMRKDASLDLKDLAPPGVKGEFVILYVTAEEKQKDLDIFKDNRLRKFVVKAQLSKNSYIVTKSLKASVSEKDGGSFLVVPSHVQYSKVQTADGEFIFMQNDSNELSCIKFICMACSSNEARSKFHKVVMPFIDHISYKANCPIHIPLISCEDVGNLCLRINYTSPYPMVNLNPHESQIIENMIPIYALFREAKNTDSSYYKFLCFYKILEGIYKHLRPALFKLAREKDINIQSQKEIVPDHPELKKFNPEYIGKPIKTLFDNELRKQYRDAIAHFLLDGGSVLNVSSFEINSRFANILLIVELCCRTVIDIQENYYQQIKNSLTSG
jgi:hypothetical protein